MTFRERIAQTNIVHEFKALSLGLIPHAQLRTAALIRDSGQRVVVLGQVGELRQSRYRRREGYTLVEADIVIDNSRRHVLAFVGSLVRFVAFAWLAAVCLMFGSICSLSTSELKATSHLTSHYESNTRPSYPRGAARAACIDILHVINYSKRFRLIPPGRRPPGGGLIYLIINIASFHKIKSKVCSKLD